MLMLFPICVLLVLFLFFSLPVIETLCGAYVIIPIFNYMFLKMGCALSTSLTLSTLIVLIVLLSLKKFKVSKPCMSEVIYSLVFIFLFTIFYVLNLSWADFIPMGERLRDYAILSSVISSPLNVLEPWYDGLTLNYYAFWYRAGAIISYILNYQTWETYHVLSAFNITFFVTLIFVIINKHLKFSIFETILLTFIVFPGSNFNGLKFFFSEDTNWWGPSRVIKGAITEFPMWSYVLGDIHPHYLNLLFFPFIISLMLLCKPAAQILRNRITLFITFLLLPSLILFNANIWDLPMYLLILFGYVTFICILTFVYKKKANNNDDILGAKSLKSFNIKISALGALLIVALISLYFSSRNIQSVGAVLSIVGGEVKRTQLYEFIDAFGVQFFLIFFSIMLLLKKNTEKVIYGILMVFSLLFIKLAVIPLFIVLVFNILRVHEDVKEDSQYVENTNRLLFETVGVVSIILWLVPEFVYLKDGYGVENARMNTIFKIYSANWAISYFFVFYLLKSIALKFNISKKKGICIIAPLTILLVCCFFKLIELRRFDYRVSLKERIEGLVKVDETFPGAKDTITKLRDMPKGIMLESTKGAYNYASHVATLSGNTSYLGWINHVQLLYKNYEDVQKRKNNMDNFYTHMNCDERRTFMTNNNIKYVVVGALEREEYGDRINNDFSCLKNIIEYGVYKIFSME